MIPLNLYAVTKEWKSRINCVFTGTCKNKRKAVCLVNSVAVDGSQCTGDVINTFCIVSQVRGRKQQGNERQKKKTEKKDRKKDSGGLHLFVWMISAHESKMETDSKSVSVLYCEQKESEEKDNYLSRLRKRKIEKKDGTSMGVSVSISSRKKRRQSKTGELDLSVADISFESKIIRIRSVTAVAPSSNRKLDDVLKLDSEVIRISNYDSCWTIWNDAYVLLRNFDHSTSNQLQPLICTLMDDLVFGREQAKNSLIKYRGLDVTSQHQCRRSVLTLWENVCDSKRASISDVLLLIAEFQRAFTYRKIVINDDDGSEIVESVRGAHLPSSIELFRCMLSRMIHVATPFEISLRLYSLLCSSLEVDHQLFVPEIADMYLLLSSFSIVTMFLNVFLLESRKIITLVPDFLSGKKFDKAFLCLRFFFIVFNVLLSEVNSSHETTLCSPVAGKSCLIDSVSAVFSFLKDSLSKKADEKNLARKSRVAVVNSFDCYELSLACSFKSIKDFEIANKKQDWSASALIAVHCMDSLILILKNWDAANQGLINNPSLI